MPTRAKRTGHCSPIESQGGRGYTFGVPDMSRVALPKETLGNSLSHRLREIFGKNADLENELTFYKLASSKIGVFAEKIRKLAEWSFPGYSLSSHLLISFNPDFVGV